MNFAICEASSEHSLRTVGETACGNAREFADLLMGKQSNQQQSANDAKNKLTDLQGVDSGNVGLDSDDASMTEEIGRAHV